MSGISIGPLLKLNVSTIDVQDIFLCSIHNYEIICANEGLIPGVLLHRPKRCDFGGNIEVLPQYLKLRPGQYKSFNISFSSNINGDFVECVEFVVKESLQVITMYIKGRIICPTLHFGKNQLDFETTALGFTSKREVTMYNDSLVPVTFSITVPDDGNEDVLTHKDFLKSPSKVSFSSHPREFLISPNEGVVEAQSSLKIQINLTPNVARIGKTTLRVDIWESKSVPVSLPIIFRNVVASMSVTPSEITVRFCFMNFSYTRNFVIENTSEVEGYFYLVPQTISESTTILYTLSTNQGYLAPGQSQDITLTIVTTTTGRQKAVLSMLTFGEEEPTACCVLICNGQGPVISVQPTTLDFKSVELLQKNTLPLTLISDSPIPAAFKASLSSKNSSWSVSPFSGELRPGQSIDLLVTIFLRDVGKHSDKIIITVPNSPTVIISLNGIGTGTSIVCKPSIFPVFDMGSIFSRQEISFPIDVSNEGSHNLRLIFYNGIELRMLAGQLQAPICDKFSIDPFAFDLPARSNKKVFCRVRSETCGTTSEQWWLHFYVDGQGKREIIDKSTFKATFVEPSIAFDKKELLFRLDMINNEGTLSHIDEISVINKSGLNLNANLSIDPPFGIINEMEDKVQNLKTVFPKNAERRIRISFLPQNEYRQKRYSQNFFDTLKIHYEEHPKADKIKCMASVNFPNIAPLPKELRFNCPLACSVVENVLLKNDGPLEIFYKFVWIDESISVKHAVSDLHDNEVGTMNKSNMEKQLKDPYLLDQTKNFLHNVITDDSFVEETEISILKSLRPDPPIVDYINQIFSIIPHEGIVPANSSQYVSFEFHGIETLSLEGRVVCNIDGGPTETIRIFGVTDVVRFQLDKDRINFGQQIIREKSRETIALKNLGKIDFECRVEMIGNSDDLLEISPMCATIPAESTMELEIISRPYIPGDFEKSFLLRVQCHLPILIITAGSAVISQVYVSLPRKNLFEEVPIEVGYRAIQSLVNPVEYTWETENGWEIIANNNTLPSTMDIDMAIERSIAQDFLSKANAFLEIKNYVTKNEHAIPYLFSPEYVLDMGYVIAGETSNYTTRVYNYGSQSTRIRLKKPDKLDTKHGINIYFNDQTVLMPGEFVELCITFKPLKLNTTEISSAVKEKIYLEVTNGFNLPIVILATVTVPFMSVVPKILTFQDILLGESMLAHVLIKNEGLINCAWEAQLPPTRRNRSDGPFYMQNGIDIYSPGESGSIKIYFQPAKPGYIESQLTIKIQHCFDPLIVVLRGRGIENKLKIAHSSINFNCVLPYSKPQEKTFTVENIGRRPIELYWQHLDKLVTHEDRLIRILSHYYQVEGILIPVRIPPATLPVQFYDFYEWLVNEMNRNLATRPPSSMQTNDNEEMTEFHENYSEVNENIVIIKEPPIAPISRKSKGTKSRKHSKRIIRTFSSTAPSSEPNLSIAMSSEPEVFIERTSEDDPDEIESLLHCFINELQKQPDFRETMKDPVKEVFDAFEKKKSMDNRAGIIQFPMKKKICIIFHGSPLAEYQPVACKTSRVLGVSLLNLNNVITEMIALGNTACSAKLREIIDAKYRQLLSVSEKSGGKKEILTIDELNSLDSLSRYEYKIETIESNLETKSEPQLSRDKSRERKTSTRDSEKDTRTPQVKIAETFCDVDLELFVELLEQRLSMEDLREGFILQTLKNRFILKEAKTLSSLLQILGDVEYPLFVSFYESLGVRKAENSISSNNETELMDETRKKLMEIDEMSLSEFDTLPDAEKDLYREQIIRIRSQDALSKRVQFQQRLSELRKKQKHRGRKSDINNKDSNSFTKIKNPTSLKTRQSNITSFSPEFPNEKKVTAEFSQKTVDKIDEYYSSLQSILSILHKWDPTRKLIETAVPKISKTLKGKERPHIVTNKTVREISTSVSLLQKDETIDRFWIWYVKINDPRNSKILDVIVDNIAKNREILNPTSHGLKNEEQQIPRSQIYSVLLPKNPLPSEIKKTISANEVFGLVDLGLQMSDISKETVEIVGPNSFASLEENLQSRITLKPGECRTFKIYFSPKSSDLFQETYMLGIVNCNSLYPIKVTGSGGVPHLDMDPTQIFKKVKQLKKGNMNEPTFFEDTETFDFGSLLLIDKDNKVHRKKTAFKFCNNSNMDLELDVSLMRNESKNFEVKPKKLFIKPDEIGIVDVIASVSKLGINEDRLLLLVKNNPRVETIELRSNGAKLDVQVEGNNISFGRVLLYRKITKNLKIHNNSVVPIFWRIAPDISMSSQIEFAPSMGWTKARSESTVIFTFLANQIGVMGNITMNFGVFLDDFDDPKEALFTEIIRITGETYDVAIDINSANPIDLGIVKVGSIVNNFFSIKNRSLHNVRYIIEFEKSDKMTTKTDRDVWKSLKQDLEISPAAANLVPEQISTVHIKFQPKFEMTLREIPFLRCNLIDLNDTATVVAEFPLTLSIEAHCAKFRLIPNSEITFGPMETCDKKTLHINVENIGLFPMKYRVKNAPDKATSVEDPNPKVRKEKSPRTETKRKGTSRHETLASLRLGPFTVSDIEGSIDPGTIKTVTIDCYPETEGHHEEKIFISVDDGVPEDKMCKILLIKVDSYIPCIDFRDLDTMFPESYLTDYIEDFNCPKEIDAHTIFARNEKCLYFQRVNIHKPHTTSLKLHNRGLVPARVTVSLRPEVLIPKNAKPDTFALDTVQETILPTSSRIFSISFTPSLIETYSGVLEVKVELPEQLNKDSNKLSIKLSGEGCVPEVTMIVPATDKRSGKSYISFGKCIIDERSSRDLSFKNIGKISAKIIVGIHHDTEMLFSIRNSDNKFDSVDFVKNSEKHEREQRSVMCTLSPDELAQLTIDFRPREVGHKKSQIYFHVLDNPYENTTLEIDGDGFVENVVIEDLPLVEIPRSNANDGPRRLRKSLKNRPGNSLSRAGSSITLASQTSASGILAYSLDYGTCFVNKLNKISFKIVNKSRECYFRFEFPLHLNVVFVPSIGHLGRFEKKEITVNFLTTEPIAYNEMTLECAVSEIRFPNERREINHWDDRETTVEWIDVGNNEKESAEFLIDTAKEKVVVPTREPSHEVLSGTSRIIQLIFSAMAAYTEFSCAVKEVNFKDTLMFQNREYTFVMENPGNVDLRFEWKIDMDAGYPTRLPESLARSNSKFSGSKNDPSRPESRSSGGILYPEADESHLKEFYSRRQRDDETIDIDYCRPITLRDKSSIIDVEPYNCSCTHTFDLYSDSIARTQRTTGSSVENSDDQAFTIKPDVGTIPARTSIQFTLRFSPLDVFDYKAYLICQIENLNPNLERPNILVTARSLLPYCHFDVEESDYLTSERRKSNINYPQAGGGDTNEHDEDFLLPRVVEFRAIGIGDSHVKEFYLINPTTENYRFTWKDMTIHTSDELPFFHCLHEEDLAESGKRTKIVFSFFAEEFGIFESFWRFSIERYELETMFLLVANITEPSINFNETKLIMRPTLVGIKSEGTLTLVNNESLQFSWKILPDTLYSEEGALQKLVVSPMSGILQPASQQILHISVLPIRVGDFIFPLHCQIRGMKNALGISVTVRVSQIIPRVLYSSGKEPKKIREAYYDRENILDFGKLNLNKSAMIKFEIANMSDVTFRYEWDLGMNDAKYQSQANGAYFLTISKEFDHVSNISESTCHLELLALRKTIIRQHPITLKIDGGPIYHMFVKATSKNPSVEFNFVNYDFGPCYIKDETSPPYVAELLITNNEKTPAIVECTFESVPHMKIDLEALSQAIPGNSTAIIFIHFRPTETLRYREDVIFLINGSTIKQVVTFQGEGMFYKICLENVRDKFVELGNVPAGKVVTRKVRIMNSARAPAKLLFGVLKKLPSYNEDWKRQNACSEQSINYTKMTREDSSRPKEFHEIALTGQYESDSMSDVLSIQPNNKVTIQPRKSVEIIVKFEPIKRMTNFVEKIGAQADSFLIPLFFVRGSCVACEFHLDQSHLYFGTVVENCVNVKKVVLYNNGDFGARFKWNVSKLKPHFDLQPISGYCSPGMDVTFDVSFHPKKLSLMLETEASIEIEKHSSLNIKCSGACCKIPNPIDIIRFSVPVRSVQTKNLTITNDTNVAWNVEATLNNGYFEAEKHFSIPPKKSYSYALTYSPLVMNNEKNPHVEKLIIKLPEGKTPLVYTLMGLSLQPSLEATISRQLPAKTKYVELLPVKNWLHKQQSFQCDIRLVNDLKTNAAQYSFIGNARLDVPANGSRDYRAIFHCYKETTLKFHITFTNDDGEYEFYEIQYKVTKPDIISTLKLTTPARSRTCYHLEIENPLEDRSVTLTAICQHRYIKIRNVPKIIGPKSSDKIIIEYSPLMPEETVTKLDVSCPELGNFPYELKLKATSALPEKVTNVTAMLGSSTQFPIVINNISNNNAEFTITLDETSFTCKRTIIVPPEGKSILEVTYEPSDVKNVKAILQATSQTLGQICFPLIGTCTLPKPQGPLTISRNSTINIAFKNVSEMTKTFVYAIEGADDFSIAPVSSNIIKSKEIATITVKFGSPNDPSEEEKQYPITGKLVVSYVEPFPMQICWVYYLRGVE